MSRIGTSSGSAVLRVALIRHRLTSQSCPVAAVHRRPSAGRPAPVGPGGATTCRRSTAGRPRRLPSSDRAGGARRSCLVVDTTTACGVGTRITRFTTR